MWRRFGLGLGGLALIAGAGWGLLAGTAPRAPDGASEDRTAQLATGRAVYAEHCAACHGDEGQGEPNWRVRKANGKLPAPPLNGDGHTWHHPDPQLRAIITQGIAAMVPEDYASDMQGFGDRLSAAEIDAVLAHIKTWWPSEYRARQADITDRAGGGG